MVSVFVLGCPSLGFSTESFSSRIVYDKASRTVVESNF